MYNPENSTHRRSDIDVNETISVAHSFDGPGSLRRTFLFTDIEGSYRQWELHPETMPAALAVHDAILHRAVASNGGRIFKTIGDAVCAVFDERIDGARAAVDAQRALYGTDWKVHGFAQPLTVRMAVQSGEAQQRDGDYAGLVLNRISRLLRAGHGGQVLVTRSMADEIERTPIAGVSLRDLGERRLRDVPGANRIFQLEIEGLPFAFPPLETLDTIAHNLPVALNTCLDREAELAEIRRLLLDSPARLITLLGPGGIGKTRLALHAATQLIDTFPDGVWFVDLSGIRDAALTPMAIASVLGVRVEPGIDTQQAIVANIGDREMLLALDNCEQIVDGVARLIAGLLSNAPSLRVLVTSRIPLELRGEQRIDIGPLLVEKNNDAGPAVQLFIERAQQIRPSFEMTGANQESVYEICRRVDGIPLALELAAARVSVLSPEALRARLSSRLSLLTSTSRDLPERHQTLRGAIEWSYALLGPEEQAAFRALSVFQGGWSLAGAQAVTGLDDVPTMETLGSLRDKSLVRLSETEDGEVRYSMLETIQEYGFEQLNQGGERETVQAAYTAHYVDLTADASQFIEGGPLQQQWLKALDREIANIRAALQWSLYAGRAQSTLDLAMNCWFYWSQRGLATEGQRWFGQALSLASEVDPKLRAGALRRLGNLCIERGELRSAEQLYRASADIERALQNLSGLASSLMNLGMVSGMLGRSVEEFEIQHEALAIFRQLGDTQGTAMSLFNLAFAARNRGNTDEALEILEQVIELQLLLKDEIGIAFNQTLAARLYKDQRDFETSIHLLELAERTFSVNEVKEGLYLLWGVRATLELAQDNIASAAILVQDAVSGYRVRGDKAFLASALETQAAILARAGDFGDPRQAAELLGEAQHLREITGLIADISETYELVRTREALEGELGARCFKLCWEHGRQRSAQTMWTEVAPLDLMELLDQVA